MSDRHDPQIRELLASLDVPAHRDGFWDDLSSDLERGYDVVRIDDHRYRSIVEPTTRPAWITALVAAAAVILVIVAVPLFTSGGETPGRVAEDRPATPTVPADPLAPDPSISDDTTPVVVDPATSAVDSVDVGTEAPWSAAPLSPDQVDGLVIEDWERSPARGWCSALAPRPDSDTIDAFSATQLHSGDDYALSWSTVAAGQVGVAAPSLVAEPVVERDGYSTRAFADGSSWVAYPEGLDPDADRWLADLAIPGQGCTYQLIADDERTLEGLVSDLRFVEGTTSQTVLRDVDDTRKIDAGAPPWDQGPIVDAELTSAAASSPDLTGGSEVPLMGFADVDDAWKARGAAIGSWGVGYDAPSGPGHDGLNQPCADCGRGVIGIGAPDPTLGSPEPPRAALAEVSWDDGSTAWITYRILDPRLPIEAALMPSSDGRLLPDGLQATVVIDGDTYQVWSHLGLDHLIGLLSQLRYVSE